jgi:hypothetical protein
MCYEVDLDNDYNFRTFFHAKIIPFQVDMIGCIVSRWINKEVIRQDERKESIEPLSFV